MTTAPNLSTQLTNEYVRREITTLLQGRGVYKLGSYGWKDHDTHDDEMIGHAMWQTDSLYFRFFDAYFAAAYAHGAAPTELEQWQQFLISSGGDFEGLTEAARLSVGLTLFQQGATERDHYEEDSFFQVHLMSSVVLLGAASDRLRDIFIAGVFHVTTDQYEAARSQSKKLNPKWYNTPFIEAAQLALANIPFSAESFAALPALAERMYAFRSVRNEVVHVVATELGRQQRDLAKRSAPDPIDDDFSYEEMRAHQKEIDAAYQKRVNEDVERLITWYKLLIEMSNHIFIVENTLRRQKA